MKKSRTSGGGKSGGPFPDRCNALESFIQTGVLVKEYTKILKNRNYPS